MLCGRLLSYQVQSDKRTAQPWKGIPKDLQSKERLASSFRCTGEAQWLQVRAGEFPGCGLAAREWTECWVPLAVKVMVWEQENIRHTLLCALLICTVPCNKACAMSQAENVGIYSNYWMFPRLQWLIKHFFWLEREDRPKVLSNKTGNLTQSLHFRVPIIWYKLRATFLLFTELFCEPLVTNQCCNSIIHRTDKSMKAEQMR